jgi:hypothetical protein
MRFAYVRFATVAFSIYKLPAADKQLFIITGVDFRPVGLAGTQGTWHSNRITHAITFTCVHHSDNDNAFLV